MQNPGIPFPQVPKYPPQGNTIESHGEQSATYLAPYRGSGTKTLARQEPCYRQGIHEETTPWVEDYQKGLKGGAGGKFGANRNGEGHEHSPRERKTQPALHLRGKARKNMA